MGLTLLIYGFALLSIVLFVWAKAIVEDVAAEKLMFILASGSGCWFVVVALIQIYFYYLGN